MAALTTGSDCGPPEVMATEPVVVGSARSASIEAVVAGSLRDPPSSPDSLVEVSQPVMETRQAAATIRTRPVLVRIDALRPATRMPRAAGPNACAPRDRQRQQPVS